MAKYTSKKATSGLVYSTDKGKMCPGCGHPAKQCCCSKKNSAPAGDGIVRVSRQTKGRKGSGVSKITGLPLAGAELKQLAKKLKQQCGTGGTIKDGAIEIQGDHRDVLVAALIKAGYQAKLAGG